MQDFNLEFEKFISKQFCRNTLLDEAIKYILFPSGKYFRPHLFFSISKDLGLEIDERFFRFACFLELHHNYTLIHDDLPCMDNDDLRRGRETLHKKYNEWLAVLAGDTLMNLSYQCLLKTKSEGLHRFCTWAMGEKGLILGQVLDLQAEKLDFEGILRMPELKTSRLMQASILGGFYLEQNSHFSLFKDLFRLGSLIGLRFQIKDDLDDYKNGERSSANIFVNNEDKSHKILSKIEAKIYGIIQKQNLKNTKEMLGI